MATHLILILAKSVRTLNFALCSCKKSFIGAFQMKSLMLSACISNWHITMLPYNHTTRVHKTHLITYSVCSLLLVQGFLCHHDHIHCVRRSVHFVQWVWDVFPGVTQRCTLRACSQRRGVPPGSVCHQSWHNGGAYPPGVTSHLGWHKGGMYPLCEFVVNDDTGAVHNRCF